MRFPSREQIAALRQRYPRGTKVELLCMDDPQAPPTGTMGEVMGIDDAGHSFSFGGRQDRHSA